MAEPTLQLQCVWGPDPCLPQWPLDRIQARNREVGASRTHSQHTCKERPRVGLTQFPSPRPSGAVQSSQEPNSEGYILPTGKRLRRLSKRAFNPGPPFRLAKMCSLQSGYAKPGSRPSLLNSSRGTEPTALVLTKFCEHTAAWPLRSFGKMYFFVYLSSTCLSPLGWEVPCCREPCLSPCHIPMLGTVPGTQVPNRSLNEWMNGHANLSVVVCKTKILVSARCLLYSLNRKACVC